MQLKRGQPALVITTAGFFVPADFERSGGMSEEFHYHPDTLAVHVGQRRSAEGEMSEPIFASTSFVFASAAEAAARFSGEKPGNIYSRFTNPTVQVFEQRIAAMEGGERAVATGSGMAAILATCLGLLKSGDHLVASNGLFGSTVVLFNNYLAKFGVSTSYVPLTDPDAWRKAIRPNTRLLFLETPATPLTEVADIASIAAIAHEPGCLLVVDNTVCTAALQRPLGDEIHRRAGPRQGRCGGRSRKGSGRRCVWRVAHRRAKPEPISCVAVSEGSRNHVGAHAGALRECARAGAVARATAGGGARLLSGARIASAARAGATAATRLRRPVVVRGERRARGGVEGDRQYAAHRDHGQSRRHQEHDHPPEHDHARPLVARSTCGGGD